MTGYKVIIRRRVSFSEDKFYSYTGGIGNPHRTLEYAIGLTTSRLPMNGPLGVFATIGQAIAFTGDITEYYRREIGIFECEYTESVSKGFWCEDGAGKLQVLGDIWVPYGTVYADNVTLLRELTQEEYGI